MTALDTTAAQIALAARAATLSVCTTGSMTLTATATGYTRAAGSFVTDGFVVGEEVTPAGFTQTTPGIITEVSALSLSILGGRTVQSSGSGRSLTVQYPALRAYENVDFTPTDNRVYVADALTPAPSSVVSFPPQGGTRQERGLYTIHWFGLSRYGVAGIRKPVDALLALFAPGTTIAVGSGTLRIRGSGPDDLAPYAAELVQQGNGFTRCTLTIPWQAFTLNVIAA